MRLTAAALSILACVSFAFAQSQTLPDILRPDPVVESVAKDAGLEIFKILPRGMFEHPAGSYKDEDNPLGVREGGAFYSFSTCSHSYNKVPEIVLERGQFGVGFAGANYGFITDLGVISLVDVTEELYAVKFLIGYKPPRLIDEIREEQRKSHRFESNGTTFSSRIAALSGHTYVLRAVSFRDADILVVFNVARINPDGSAEITWKPLRKFDRPVILDRTDAVLAEKIRNALSIPKFSLVKFEVVNNKVVLSGDVERENLPELIRIAQGLGVTAIDNKVRAVRRAK